MTMLTSNAGKGFFAVLALMLAAVANTADTQVSGQVIVQAERPTTKIVGRSEIGAPIVLVELQHHVSYSDLELSIPSNAKVLQQRVHRAVRSLCADLDRLYPVAMGGDDCARKAEQDAMSQVDAAVALAQARKNAAAK